MGKMGLLFFFGFLLNQGKALSQLNSRQQVDSAGIPVRIQVLPQNFYKQNLSFICKKEVQLQKLLSVPIFIRAGSKEYVDYLEKKPNAVWLPRQ